MPTLKLKKSPGCRHYRLVVDGVESAFSVGFYKYWSKPDNSRRGRMAQVYYALPAGVHDIYSHLAFRSPTQKGLLKKLQRQAAAFLQK